MSGAVEQYVTQFRRALAREFVISPRIVTEVRDHLIDATAEQERIGLSHDEAEAAAIAAFGPAQDVASGMAASHVALLHRVVLLVALALGAAIAWADSRPGWDDTGVSAAALIAAAAVCGAIAPRRATLWGLVVGAGIPAYAIVRHPVWSTASMGLVLLFPVAGAWLGRTGRRLLQDAIA